MSNVAKPYGLKAADITDGTFVSTVETIAFASTIDDDCDSGSIAQKITLTGDITSLTLSGGVDNQPRMHRYVQDGTGGHTLALSGIGGTAPVINTTAGATTEVWYKKIGNSWQAIMAIDYGVIS